MVRVVNLTCCDAIISGASESITELIQFRTDDGMALVASPAARVKVALKSVARRFDILVRRTPHGRQIDALIDQVALLSGSDVRQILDVGAYVGDTAIAYKRAFPNAVLHCFEPMPASFARLKERVSRVPGVVVDRRAIAASSTRLELIANRFAATSSRLEAASGAERIVGPGLLDVVERLTVEATTIDAYCRERRIDYVDILKLDVQGGELEAINGSSQMLKAGRIALVYIELLLAPIYRQQPFVGDVLAALESCGYRLYGFYNLAYGADSSLYQLDAILVSPQTQARLTRRP
jgi:FkbM family methyltransferase